MSVYQSHCSPVFETQEVVKKTHSLTWVSRKPCCVCIDLHNNRAQKKNIQKSICLHNNKVTKEDNLILLMRTLNLKESKWCPQGHRDAK